MDFIKKRGYLDVYINFILSPRSIIDTLIIKDKVDKEISIKTMYM